MNTLNKPTLQYPLEINLNRLNDGYLFPINNTLIPYEIIRSIATTYLSPKEVANLMSINVQWHYLIGNNHELYNKKVLCNRCLHLAKNLEISFGTDMDPFVAEIIKSLFKCKIAQFEAQFIDLEQSKLTANEIKHKDFRDKAYVEIIKYEALKDLDKAKLIAMKEMDYKNRKERSKAFLEIVKVEVTRNHDEARRTAKEIEDREIYSEALLIFEKSKGQQLDETNPNEERGLKKVDNVNTSKNSQIEITDLNQVESIHDPNVKINAILKYGARQVLRHQKANIS